MTTKKTPTTDTARASGASTEVQHRAPELHEDETARLARLDKDLGLAIIDQHFLIKTARELEGDEDRAAALLRAVELFNNLIYELHEKAKAELERTNGGA